MHCAELFIQWLDKVQLTLVMRTVRQLSDSVVALDGSQSITMLTPPDVMRMSTRSSARSMNDSCTDVLSSQMPDQ